MQIIKDDNRPIFVAVDNNEVVLGYVFCIFEQYLDSNILTDVKTLYIDDLCVDENLRQHIGKQLFMNIPKILLKERCYNLTLNVWSRDNASAMKFYESCGLKPQKVHMKQFLINRNMIISSFKKMTLKNKTSS